MHYYYTLPDANATAIKDNIVSVSNEFFKFLLDDELNITLDITAKLIGEVQTLISLVPHPHLSRS